MMNEMIKKQNFGVEIEMNNMNRSKAQKIVAKVLGSTNTGYESSYDNHYVIDRKGRMWKCESDSSISGSTCQATELVTPVLQYDDIETLQEVIRALRKEGAKTDSSCGIHVHVDGSNHTPASLERLVNFMIARQDLIYESLEIGERGSRWCRRLNKELFAAMKKNRNLDRNSLEMLWYSSVNDGYRGGIDHRHYNETRYHGVKHRIIPTWEDMCRLKEIFFRDDEAVIQIHPQKSEYVNNMPNCLHLWKYQGDMPLPPAWMV